MAGERDAYLVYHGELRDRVKQLLESPLAKGGRFDSKVPSEEEIIRMYQLKQLYAIGVIDLSETIIGTEVKVPSWFEVLMSLNQKQQDYLEQFEAEEAHRILEEWRFTKPIEAPYSREDELEALA